MATKRSAPDERDSRQQPWKRQKNEHSHRPNHGKKSFKKAHPVNELKSTVRSVRRLLDRENLPANIRVEKERELQTAQRELARAEKASKRSDMIGKYHKIRFFERQKAERRLKKARRELKECQDEGGERDRLRGEVEKREVDVNYAIYFPLERDYVKLWPEKGVEERQGDREMWELVRGCMRKGTLADLREGRLDGKVEEEEDEEVDSTAKAKKKKKKTEKRERSVKQEAGSEESDNESGGGFFE